jgi:hypothetical protein
MCAEFLTERGDLRRGTLTNHVLNHWMPTEMLSDPYNFLMAHFVVFAQNDANQWRTFCSKSRDGLLELQQRNLGCHAGSYEPGQRLFLGGPIGRVMATALYYQCLTFYYEVPPFESSFFRTKHSP